MILNSKINKSFIFLFAVTVNTLICCHDTHFFPLPFHDDIKIIKIMLLSSQCEPVLTHFQVIWTDPQWSLSFWDPTLTYLLVTLQVTWTDPYWPPRLCEYTIIIYVNKSFLIIQVLWTGHYSSTGCVNRIPFSPLNLCKEGLIPSAFMWTDTASSMGNQSCLHSCEHTLCSRGGFHKGLNLGIHE